MTFMTRALVAACVALALGACGGDDCSTGLCDTGLAPTPCPSDRSTFVGPLPEQCL